MPDAPDATPWTWKKGAQAVTSTLLGQAQELERTAVPCEQVLYADHACGSETLLACSSCGAPRCFDHLSGQCPPGCDESHQHRAGRCNGCFVRAWSSSAENVLHWAGQMDDSWAMRIRERFGPQ